MANKQLIEIFCNKLCVECLTEVEKIKLLSSITDYLLHGRNDNMVGRSEEYVIEKLDTFIAICNVIGLSNQEMCKVITLFPGILNSINSFYQKYLILGVLETEENMVRRTKFVTKPRDYAIGMQQIYARYKLICESGYNNISWNALVHATKSEFAKIFVLGTYSKPYQLFSDINSAIKWLDDVDIKEIDIESFKELDANKELVLKYEQKSQSK